MVLWFYIVQSLYLLNPRFQTYSHLWLYSSVCVGPCWDPDDMFSHEEAQIEYVNGLLTFQFHLPAQLQQQQPQVPAQQLLPLLVQLQPSPSPGLCLKIICLSCHLCFLCLCQIVSTVKPVLKGHSKIDKMKVLKTGGSLMQV